jgi:hypothetical protein
MTLPAKYLKNKEAAANWESELGKPDRAAPLLWGAYTDGRGETTLR